MNAHIGKAGGKKNIDEIVADAELPPLLAAMYVSSGDEAFIADRFRPNQGKLLLTVVPQGGMSQDAQREARALLSQRLGEFVPDVAIGDAPRQRVIRAIDFLTEGKGSKHHDLLFHELGLASTPAEAIDIAPGFKVAIIGAGISGLSAARELSRSGIDYLVLEKNPDVGGTWLDNVYPGARLDTNNFAYSFSWEHRLSWPDQFSKQKDILQYLQETSDKHDLRSAIRFGCEVDRLVFDEEDRTWAVHYREKGESRPVLKVNAVVTAVGQLNQPSLPRIEGMERFKGASFHTARWDRDYDVAGKKVALIGTGASAFQVAPTIAPVVESLEVFQRTPPWMAPTPTYHAATPEGLIALLHTVPEYSRWLRLWQFWIATEGRFQTALVDPDWKHEISMSEANETFRRGLLGHIETHFGDRPDLLEKVTPSYAPGAKRLLRDDGRWARTLKRDNVSLVTTAISQIEEAGVRTEDGVLHEVDLIVYGTGFKAADFLTPIEIIGPGGRNLHDDIWKGDARAYCGVVCPEMPNLFCIFGPNTNLVVHGSIVFMSECGTNYAVSCIRKLASSGWKTMTVRKDRFDAYNRRIDEANAQMVWGASTVNSWYRNKFGRSAQNWPFSLLEYWEITREADLDDFTLAS